MLNDLRQLKDQGKKRIPNPVYNAAANPVGDWILKNSMNGIDVFKNRKFVRRGHQIKDIISWQETLYLNTLLNIGGLASTDLHEAMTSDEPRILLWRDLTITYDGNHRLWNLRRLGCQRYSFPTLEVPTDFIWPTVWRRLFFSLRRSA